MSSSNFDAIVLPFFIKLNRMYLEIMYGSINIDNNNFSFISTFYMVNGGSIMKRKAFSSSIVFCNCFGVKVNTTDQSIDRAIVDRNFQSVRLFFDVKIEER